MKKMEKVELTQKVIMLLLEFDSIKGPIVRKIKPKNSLLPEKITQTEVFIWVLRSETFSVKKIDSYTAFARGLELRDPNFSRKKRQFGLAIITQNKLTIQQAESLLEDMIKKSVKKGNNKSYFRMLQGLFEVVEEATEIIGKVKNDKEYESSGIPVSKNDIQAKATKSETLQDTSTEMKKINLLSNRLSVFKKMIVNDRRSNMSYLIGNTQVIKNNERQGEQLLGISLKKMDIQVEMRGSMPEGVQHGLDIFSRIIGAVPSTKMDKKRLLAGAEFLDKLLLEKVDILYYLPFFQYLMGMENYTITEFKKEGFERQFNDLRETHGGWIDCFLDKDLTNESLSDFFAETGTRREGLEFLIDLLFVKIVTIL
jgi:hypothetical protein